MTKNLLHRVLIIFAWLTVCNVLQAEEDRQFWVFDASNGLADNSAQTIMCTKTGRMVISTIGHINFYDGNAFSHVDPTPEDVFALPKYNGHYHMYFDRHHHLWLKDRQSVTCLDLLMERFISDVGSVFTEMGMTKPVDDMFGDQNNELWMRSGDSLYNIDSAYAVPIRYHSELIDIDVFNHRVLLQFFADGMTHAYDVKTQRLLYAVAAFEGPDKMRYASTGVLLPTKQGFYQIRNGKTEGVLLHFDAGKHQWKVMLKLPYHLNNMVEHEGRLYIASEYGYWVYDLSSKDLKHVRTLKLSKGRTLETDVNTLAFDRQGGMWIGTEKRGLLYAKPHYSPFKVYNWEEPKAQQYYNLLEQAIGPTPDRVERRLNCIYKDSRGWTWKGTYTGLVLEKTDGARPRLYTQRHGLSNDVVHCIVEASDHDIWIGTSFGICRLFIRGDSVAHIESYTGADDVPVESFANGRAYCCSDGNIIMQSLDHMVVFNPVDFHYEELRNMRISPKLVRVMVNGITVKAGMEMDGRVVLDRAVSRVKFINVDYNLNSLSLTFSALNYYRPLQTYYRVRVKGCNGYNDWRILSRANSGGQVDKSGLLHLPLMGIKPGRYNVEVQSSMSPDTWLQEPFVWVVNVEEPWWRSSWSYLLLAVLVFFLLTYNFVLYNHNMKLRMKRNNDELGIIRLIKNYAERCKSLESEVLTPYSATENNQQDDAANDDFLNAMVKIVPYVNSHQSVAFNMRDLGSLTGRKSAELYGLLSDNLHRNPRVLLKRLRLQEAVQLLKTTDMSVAEIAQQCMFVSANYFIACFYHEYRQTPENYRYSTAL